MKKIKEVIYKLDEEALQRIEERLFELNAPYAIEENKFGDGLWQVERHRHSQNETFFGHF